MTNATARNKGKRPPRADLPTFYYHTHFMEMLHFVETNYNHVLSAQEHQFYQHFKALSFGAQCLYVRLVNRRGRCFTIASLRYTEIRNLPSAINELLNQHFVASPKPSDRNDILNMLTRAQLVTALQSISVPVKSSAKKAEVMALAVDHLTPEQLLITVPVTQIIVQRHIKTVAFLLFLYFGQRQQGLTQFTMRDLGLVRAHSLEENYEPRFNDREDAQQAFYFASSLEALELRGCEAETLYNDVQDWPTPVDKKVADLRDSLAIALGKQLEQQPDLALEVYRKGESVICTERIVRLLLSTDRRDEAKRYLEQCIAAPSCDEEALFATDIYQRKFDKKRTSTVTDVLRDAPVILLDDAYRGSPEWAAVRYFERQGKRAFRAENRFWRTLFGLLFWDLIFESDRSVRSSPFERVPAILTEGRFWAVHQNAIEERLALLNDYRATQRHMLTTIAKQFGVINGVFRWRQSTVDAINAFIEVAPALATAQILRSFCQDYLSAKHGYPDLLVIDGRDIRFVEIKAEGDQLRRNQLLRLKQLSDAGFSASVMRVQWVLDPAQAYVVVDVETTGGKGATHRVTEIGAVKVVGDSVVDTFHTLVNPQRAIPPGITRLTGITNAMVEDAPIFADIANTFSAFVSDAIFVAHNVEFDYGFVASEFERLGKGFRRPKLCTCASMRKLFPGKNSYSLAALCSDYDIPLNTHHRALCDAKAAAELLVIINEQRQALLQK